MKLSESTLTYLKNFSSINSGIVFQEGNVIRTISKQQNILAKATVEETFTDKFAIYDLNRFLALIGSLSDPSLDISSEKKNIKIKSGSSQTVYGLSDESLVVTAPAKDLKVSGEVKFTLSKDVMSSVLKMAGILGLPNISVRGDRNVVSVAAVDVKNPDSDVFSVEVGKTKTEFEMIFSTENFKMIPGDYEVTISSKGISHLKNTKEPIEYWIAIESGSRYAE
jgi:hypothetical protein